MDLATRTVKLTEEERERMFKEYGEVVEELSFKGIRIYADGACSCNPGPGGYGAIIIQEDGEVREIHDRSDFTTNNRMELTAVIQALEEINKMSKRKPPKILIVSDSKYVIDVGSRHMWTWARFGWTGKAGGGVIKNVDLCKQLHALAAPHDIRWVWRKGHNGHPELERCHDLAQGGEYVEG